MNLDDYIIECSKKLIIKVSYESFDILKYFNPRGWYKSKLTDVPVQFKYGVNHNMGFFEMFSTYLLKCNTEEKRPDIHEART